MNSLQPQKKPTSWLSVAVPVGLMIIIIGSGSHLIFIDLPKDKLRFQEERAARDAKKVAETDKAKVGYPAPESEIVAGKYYFCDASLTDQWSDRVLNYLVLQEMTTDGKYWTILVGKKRLFQVNSTVPSSQFYLAERSNGILALKRIGPVPPSIPEAKEPQISAPVGVDLRI